MTFPDSELEQAVNAPVLTVSELTLMLKEVVEGAFPAVWVAGEISNFSRPQSGHCYFTLKDDAAQLRAVIWRTAAARVPFELGDGLEVICQGRLDLYPQRGSYQLVVQQIQPKGMGALEMALRRLREKLAREGLFDARHKKPLVRFPRRIAFVTSPTGAAIRDFLEVLNRRWRGAAVLVVPVRVQGEGAAREIADAIARVNGLTPSPDALVVGRGGGSLEDLWAFNEEIVVRAVYASRIPVVSAVGHEIDVTLCDLVADVRALTPSEAAERVVPSADEIRAALATIGKRLAAALRSRAAAARARLAAIETRAVFRRPADRVQHLAQAIDELSARAQRAIRQRHTTSAQRCSALAARLESLNPEAVLRRGYSMTHRARDGGLLRDANDVPAGERIVTRLAIGEIESVVEETKKVN
jgi:exodeoxyribonuclease VII large subunit